MIASHLSEFQPGEVAFVAPRDRIAVGVDFSPCSDSALEVGANLALRTGVELVPIHVCEPPPRHLLSQSNSRPEAIMREHMDDARIALDERCRQQLPRGVRVTPKVVTGTPHDSLASTAGELSAALLVVGTHGRTGIRRLFMGSVAERTVRTSPIDVLVARGRPTKYRRILVPTDFSALADRALALAVRLCALDGKIEVLHCCPASPLVAATMTVPALTAGNYYERATQAANAAGQRLLAKYDGACAEIDFSCVANVPIMGIRARLEDDSFDLVVMGGSGRTGVERLLVGSVAEATVRRAPCSVLVAKQEPEAVHEESHDAHDAHDAHDEPRDARHGLPMGHTSELSVG